MRIGVLGTGMVGEAIATKLAQLGHQVCMGSRTRDNAKGLAWARTCGGAARAGTFADAAELAELVFSCTHGVAAPDALAAAGAEALAGKIVIDVSNPLVFEGGKARLAYGGDDSLGERLQRAFPRVHVVKTLNTVNCAVMVDPARVPGAHTMFVCGDDAAAKATVTGYLREWFGWSDILDLGGITGARLTEGMMPLWLTLWQHLHTADFNLHVARPVASGAG